MRNLFFYSFALDALVTLDSSKTRQLMVKRFTCTNIALPKHQVITKTANFLFSGKVEKWKSDNVIFRHFTKTEVFH